MNLELDMPKFDQFSNDQENASVFSWNNEFEFIEKNAVKEWKIVREISPVECIGNIITLEGDSFDLDCKVYGGIMIVSSNNKEFIGSVYESLHQMLMKCSEMYVHECFSNF